MDTDLADSVTLVVHELRRPLGYVATAAQLLAQESPELQVRSRCDAIERTARRMLRMTESVLEVAGMARTAAQPCSYVPVEVVEQVVADARSMGGAIRFLAGPGVEDRTAWGVPERFEALVQSLVNNAFDHGAAKSEVVVTARNAGNGVELDIENAVGGTQGHSGLGLGLMICARLADLCGAELEATAGSGWYRSTVRLGPGDPGAEAHSQHRERWPMSRHRLRAGAASS